LNVKNLTSKYTYQFPIRLKILLMILLLVTSVVSFITFSMVRLFQKDKTIYIFDLTSVVALHMAEEADTILKNYQDQLSVFAEFLFAENIPEKERSEIVKDLFRRFDDLISLSVYEDGIERLRVYNQTVLQASHLTRADLIKFRREYPIPFSQISDQSVYLENSTFSVRLPTFTLAISYHHPSLKGKVVLVAVVRLTKLINLGGKSRIFDTFLVDSKGALLSHRNTYLVLERKSFSELPIVKAFLEGKELASTLEYPSETGETMLGAFAQITVGRLAAVVQIPKAIAYLAAKELTRSILWMALFVLSVSSVIGLVWSFGVTRHLARLMQATQTIAKGTFDVQVQVKSRDEIGQLGDSFNQMASELKHREEELQKAHAALVQSEKMAAFGQLGAGIAHEVKNPLAGILGYAQLAIRKLDKENPLYRNLEIIERETKRCKAIIDNLMRFTRQERMIFETVSINQVAEDAIAIVDHQLAMNKVKIEKELGPGLPQIRASGNQLQQVLMNLMINAQQAMEQGGAVKISTRQLDDQTVEIRVSDTGPGILPGIQAKIFEPFFTTKPVGKGTGLGLSVSFGIINNHHGQIRVESEVGKGATFIITLPLKGPKENGDQETRLVEDAAASRSDRG
jgi:two-component system, NtrC family, sensor kinase